jgi:hypothetical protein
VFRTLFGKLRLDSPRLYHCGCCSSGLMGQAGVHGEESVVLRPQWTRPVVERWVLTHERRVSQVRFAKLRSTGRKEGGARP